MTRRTSKNPDCRVLILFRALIPAVFLLTLIAPAPHVEAAQRQPAAYVSQAEAEMKINLDGTVDIVETLHFHFAKKKTGITFDLLFPLEGEPLFEAIELARPQAGEEVKYVRIPPQDKLKSHPLAFTTNRKRDRVRLGVETTGLEGECLFRISYQWSRGVVLKEGRAVMAGPLLAVRPDTRVETMKWTLVFPSAIRTDLIRISPVSIHPMTANWIASNTVSLIVNQPFDKIDGLSILVSMPAAGFPLIFTATDETPLSSLFERADRKTRNLSRLNEFRLSILGVVVPLVLAGLIIYLALFLLQLTGLKKLKPGFASWPVTKPPALVATLAKPFPARSRLLLATLVQLINRKEISWQDEVFEWRNPDRNDFSGFSTWEILLLQWLFSDHPDYDHVLAPERLRTAARDPDFHTLAHRFQKQLQQSFRHSGLLNVRFTSAFRLVFSAFGLLFAAMAAVLFLITHAASSFLLFIPSAFFAFSAASFRFLTERGVGKFRDTRRFSRLLHTPELLVEACGGRLNEAEVFISALPVAVALNRQKAFFSGLRALPLPAFTRAAYALLHVYRKQPLPMDDAPWQDSEELKRLDRGLEEIERVLSAWKEIFDTCFT